MYADKPMQGLGNVELVELRNSHFASLADHLKRALATYTPPGSHGNPTYDTKQAIAKGCAFARRRSFLRRSKARRPRWMKCWSRRLAC